MTFFWLKKPKKTKNWAKVSLNDPTKLTKGIDNIPCNPEFIHTIKKKSIHD